MSIHTLLSIPLSQYRMFESAQGDTAHNKHKMPRFKTYFVNSETDYICTATGKQCIQDYRGTCCHQTVYTGQQTLHDKYHQAKPVHVIAMVVADHVAIQFAPRKAASCWSDVGVKPSSVPDPEEELWFTAWLFRFDLAVLGSESESVLSATA